MEAFSVLVTILCLTAVSVNSRECPDDQPCQNSLPRYGPSKNAFSKLFETLDTNNDNRISFIEFINYAHPKELRKRLDNFELFDQDHNGYLNLDEFQKLSLSTARDLATGKYAIFKNIDANEDGEIDVFEYLLYNRQRVPPFSHSIEEQIDLFRKTIDANHDSVVSPKELLDYRLQLLVKHFQD